MPKFICICIIFLSSLQTKQNHCINCACRFPHIYHSFVVFCWRWGQDRFWESYMPAHDTFQEVNIRTWRKYENRKWELECNFPLDHLHLHSLAMEKVNWNSERESNITAETRRPYPKYTLVDYADTYIWRPLFLAFFHTSNHHTTSINTKYN